MIPSLLRAGIHATVLAALVYGLTLLAKQSRPATKACWWWLVSAEFAFGWLIVVPIHASLPRPEHMAAVTEKAALAIAETPDGTPVVKQLVIPWVLWTLGTIWLGGVIWNLTAALLSTLKLRRIARSADLAGEASQRIVRRMSAEIGLSAPPRVLTTSELDSPAIYGVLSPILFLPSAFEALTEEEQQMAFVHELAHIRRRDGLLAIVPELARAAFWFFPVAHWARREWIVQRELACDAEVMERTHCEPEAYGEFLLRIVESQRKPAPAPALGVTADFRSLKRRLMALSGTLTRPRPGFLSVVLVGALSLPVACQSPKTDGGALKNAGMEDGDSGPDSWNQGAAIDGVAYTWETGVSHGGKHSISIKKDAQRYFPIAQWSQSVPYDGKSVSIQFSGWVKTRSMTKAVLDVQFLSEDGSMMGHHWVAYIGAKNAGDEPSTFDWKRVGGVAKVPDGTKSVNLAVQDYGPGQIWFDDASAKFGDAAETDPLKEGSTQ